MLLAPGPPPKAATAAADELRTRAQALMDRKLPEAEQRAAQQALEQAQASPPAPMTIAAGSIRSNRHSPTHRQIAEARRQLAAPPAAALGHGARPPTPARPPEERSRRTGRPRARRLAPPPDEADSLLVAARTPAPSAHRPEISTGQVRMAAIEAMLASGREAGATAACSARSAATRSPPNGMRSTPSRARRQELAGNSAA